MMSLDTDRGRASLLLVVLGVALAVALAPFATGLIGIPVLYVIFRPLYGLLHRRLGPRVSAGLVTAVALVLLVVPAIVLAGMVLTEVRALTEGISDGALLERVQRLRIGRLGVGQQLAALWSSSVEWLGRSAPGLLGTVTRQALNLVIALFGLYYLLLKPDVAWKSFSAWLPFSDRTVERLKARFHGVTVSTVIGTGLVAVLQGVLVGLAFVVAGVPNARFWSVITVVMSILPVVGSGMVWGPAALWLALNGRWPAAILMTVWGLVVSNLDFLVRPLVFKRWAHIHPVTTLVGALAGVGYFGLLGLLIGPLALSYFFELMTAYRTEFAEPSAESTPQTSKGTLIS